MLVFTLSINKASSSELGNINFPDNPEADQIARQASAEALHGLALIFQALSSRELRESDGSKALEEASDNLGAASESMFEIVEQGLIPFVDRRAFQELINASDINQAILSDVETLEGMYAVFAGRLRDLAALVSEQAGIPSENRIFNEINTLLDDIFPLGNVISQIVPLG